MMPTDPLHFDTVVAHAVSGQFYRRLHSTIA